MADIQPIETRYKGCRFRSRLEARWAVFFDDLAIPWEYEKEGYILPTGKKYLPDFWLPSLGYWWEVKGGPVQMDEADKCEDLRDGTDHPVFLVRGTPPELEIILFCWDVGGAGGGSSAWQVERLVWSRENPLVPCICAGRRLFADHVMVRPIPFIDSSACAESTLHPTGVELLIPEFTMVDKAYETARSARFEHGESGGG